MAAAWFYIDTDNDIVSEVSAGGKTSYVNATRTVRQGLELNSRHQRSTHWKALGSLTSMQATHDQRYTPNASGTVPAGNRLPGIPQRQAFVSLQWSQHGFSSVGQASSSGLEAAIDWLARSALWTNDANTETALGYGIVNARLKQRLMPFERMKMDAYLGVDNLTNRVTVGSVIVNQASRQFYEPGLPRSWVVGLQAKLAL
jgi:iron complex outermembrane receptor protein